MLLKCPECDLQVSEKAVTCPHCGYPLKATNNRKKKKVKRMRLPNGFGSITELKRPNLRNPFYVRVCVGKKEDGTPIHKNLKPKCSFPTYQDAYSALVEYHRNPYDLEPDITVKELYERWTDSYFQSVAENYQRTIQSAWQYCSTIYSMCAKDVRARHIKGCMEEGYRIETRGKRKGEKVFPSACMKTKIKSMFNIMFDYALEYEIVDRNYARTFDISSDVLGEAASNKKAHIIFTDEEMDILWRNVNKVKFVDWILIQCYMGWRPQELATLRLDEVHVDEWYMCAGMKTDAGKQQIVPIHTKIKELVQQNIDFAKEINSEYLFNDKGQTHAGSWKITYDKYAKRFEKVINQLGLNSDHRPHDPRVTFITKCKKSNVDKFAIKEMVGHSIKDITESVYTVRDLEWLRSDIEKIK